MGAFSPELIAAVESAFSPSHVPHETKILRILAAVVPVVRQECGADDMISALEAVVDSVIAEDERGNVYALGRLQVAVEKSSAALAKARGEA